MSSAYKCDRCKKTYEGLSPNQSENNDFVIVYNNKRPDLCINCHEEVHTAFMAGMKAK